MPGVSLVYFLHSKCPCFMTHEVIQTELEQLESLRSKDTPAASWLSILLSYIGSQAKRRQSQGYKFNEFAEISDSLILKQTLHATHLPKLLDKICKYEPVLLKIQSGHDSVHRQTDGQGETSIPPFQLCWSGGYNNKGIELYWPSIL